jgi:hypothetical protein
MKMLMQLWRSSLRYVVAGFAVMLVAVAGSVTIAQAITRDGSPSKTVKDSIGEDVYAEKIGSVDEWLKTYDPAEIDHLFANKSADYGDVSKESLVSALEFRRACRGTLIALNAVTSAAPETRSQVVERLMSPVLSRLNDRELYPESTMAGLFGGLATKMSSGNLENVQLTLEHNCDDAFGPWTDR